jgi:hypothetical protein
MCRASSGEATSSNIGDAAGSVTSYKYGKRPGEKRKCGPILVLRCGKRSHYGVIRKLHPRRAATRGVLLGRLRSYERRGSARQTGLRPCDGKQHELTICEKTGREAEVRAHPGPSVWGSRPLRGNQEAPSQTGGHARCSAREAAFVRAPWVGPPNRASPMRAVVIVLEPRGANTWVVRPGVVSRCRQTGLARVRLDGG